ncbi:MAG: NAD(P)H-binding protein [Spirosomataceae bacterium]
MTSEKRTALVIGGTGLVGGTLITQLLASEKYGPVKVLVRKPLDLIHPKLESVIFDFDRPDAAQVKADDIFCCLGTTMKKAGSKEAFYKVDFTYPHEIAKMGLENGATRFAIVTAMGADTKSLFYYNRVKGDIEEALKQLGYETLLIFRPSLLVGQRPESRLGEKIGEQLTAFFKFLIPAKYRAIEAQKVAKAMVAITSSNVKGTLVYESDVMQEF